MALSNFFTISLRFDAWYTSGPLDDVAMHKMQLEKLSNYLILKDKNANLVIDEHEVTGVTRLSWINRGELVSGSFIANEVSKFFNGMGFEFEDIDIYFHSKDDAEKFCRVNGIYNADFSDKKQMCTSFYHLGDKLNLIWGVSYANARDLISEFDIRACSMAYDPNNSKVYAVSGAIDDAKSKSIVYNPIPRAVSIRRLLKYTQKGFSMSKYQRLFFAELIRTDIYSSELELTTGYER